MTAAEECQEAMDAFSMNLLIMESILGPYFTYPGSLTYPPPLHRGEAQNEHKVTTAIDGPPPSLGGSPNNPMMVTHQKEVCYRLGIWHLNLSHKTETR